MNTVKEIPTVQKSIEMCPSHLRPETPIPLQKDNHCQQFLTCLSMQ